MSATLAELAGAIEVALPELRLERNVRLAPYTSFAVGGPADLLLVVEEISQLERAVALANAQHVPWTVLGAGTNVLVADEGFRGLVIINAAQAHTMATDGLLVAASGALLCELARWAVGAGWRGLQWAVGIPGTVGGAVVGNAGAYGGCMADIVRWVRLLRPGGRVEQVPVEALAYGYRTSALKREAASGERTVVLEAALQLMADDPVALSAEAAANQAQRERSTPRGCCAGSMFKRTAHYPAGYLIDKAGLKGLAIGAAQVSPVHANFIMNTGGATAREVRQLIERVQQEVWQRYAQHLELEIELVGDWHWT